MQIEHVSDLLAEYQNGAELTGWFEYFHLKDEIQFNRLAHAIARAFNGDKTQAQRPVDDEEEVIDTTKPEFAEQFGGFTNTKTPQRPLARVPNRGTQILMG